MIDNESEKAAFVVLRNIASVGVKYEKTGIHFFPAFEWADGQRTFSVEDLTENDYQILYSLKLQELPLLIRARMAEILWAQKRDHKMANLVCTCYYQLHLATFDGLRWPICFKYLRNTVMLSAKIGSTDYLVYLQYIYNKIVELNGEDESFLSIKLIELLLEQKRWHEFSAIIPVIDKIILNPGNIYKARQAFEIKTRALLKQGNSELAMENNRNYACFLEGRADYESADNVQSLFTAVQFLQDAIQLFRNNNAPEDGKRVHRKLVEIQKRIPPIMIPISGKADMTKTYKEIIPLFDGLSIEEHIVRITTITPLYKESAWKKQVLEEATLFERQVKHTPLPVQKDIKLREYVELWLREIAPNKLAKTTLYRTRQDIERFMLALGNIKLTQLRPNHFRNLYADLRKQVSERTGKPFSEHTIEGVHSALCGILSDAMAAGYVQSNPAWRTYKPIAKKQKKTVADEETAKKLLSALEQEDMKYEVYFKLILLTGIRRGECCGIQWGDIDWSERSIHICKNVVKVTGEELFVKSPKTTAGDRYVYFSQEMENLLKRYKEHCTKDRPVTNTSYLFRRQDCELPMSPSTFTSKFKDIIRKHGLPENLNVHSLRHTNASLLIANGTDVATVAGLLGHSQVSTTLDIYIHSFDAKRKEASRALQEKLESS